jgi:hypothetical protein
MKTFKELREAKAPTGKAVFSKKVKGIDIAVHKNGNKFTAYVDGDKLDTYSSQKEAEKMANEFVKQYKG